MNELEDTVLFNKIPAETQAAVATAHEQSAATRMRQSRLRAAVLFFLLAFGVSMLLRLFHGGWILWPMHTGFFASLVAVYWALSHFRQLTLRQVRDCELAVFVGMTVTLGVTYALPITTAAQSGNTLAVMSAQKNHLISTIMVMFAYGIFIPNTGFQAAKIIMPIAFVPPLTAGAVWLAYGGESLGIVDRDWNLNVLFASAGLATYGASVLNTLRQDVFEARRLNQYQLGEKLGAGAMGEVYRAEHRLLKRPCAVKLIRPDSQRDARALSRFEQEVRSAARLSHPNIIEVYDYGHTDDGTFYYVMEYLDGQNLEEVVKRSGPRPAEQIIQILRQVCSGLAEAHAAGMIHRDLKPANIFLAKIGQRDNVAKVLDFGLVWQRECSATTTQHPTEMAGTPAYMAPEQIESDPALDHRADLYALGCVGYYLMTGRPPFDGSTPIEVMMAHVHSPVVPPSSIAPAIDEGLEQVVLQCMRKEPSERFQSANELNAALLACADIEKASSVPGTTNRHPAEQQKEIDR